MGGRPSSDPALPDEATVDLLDDSLRRALRGLRGPESEEVGRRLAAAAMLVDEDPTTAMLHARIARTKGSRVGAVREAVGVIAYVAGDYEEARRELTAAQRMTGTTELVAVLADCERALGRPERALEYLVEYPPGTLGEETAAELAVVCSGALLDRDDAAGALDLLEARDVLGASPDKPWVLRVWYAYATALRAAGRQDDAHDWFERVAAEDDEGETDAAEVLASWEG